MLLPIFLQDDSIPLREKILQLPILTTTKWLEENVPVCLTDVEQSGGGDTGAMGLVMCVPDMKITGLVTCNCLFEHL